MPKIPRRYYKYLKHSDLQAFRKECTPPHCPILGTPDFDPVVDHDHKSGMVRGVISRTGNTLLGKAENHFNRMCVQAVVDLPTALRNMADYLEQKDTGVLHPKGLKQLTSRFRGKKKKEQLRILRKLDVIIDDIESAKSSKARCLLFRKAMQRSAQ
jgi:hypothetical protein